MVRPPGAEVVKLMRVAREIREATDESAHSVGAAVGQHQAFSRTRGPASALERSLVLDAAREGASQVGLGTEEVSGSLDVVATSHDTIRRYRVKRVKLNAEGDYEVICGEGSSLLVAEPEGFLREEKWILGYIVSDDHTIEHLMAAEVVGWRGDGPVYLMLGPVIDLSYDQPPRGFTSTNDGLPGFDDDDDEDEGGETGNANGL